MKLCTNLIKVLIVVPFTIAANLSLLLSETISNLSMKDLFIGITFDMQNIKDKKSLVIALGSIVVIILFNLLYGTYLYKDINVNGAYIFTRVVSRKKWFYEKIVHIILYSILYTFLYVSTTWIICMIHKKAFIYDLSLYSSFVSMWIALTIIIILFTIFINFFAIYQGEHIGFLMGYALLVIIIELCLYFEDIPVIGQNYLLSFVNPITVMSVYLVEEPWIKIIIYLYNTAIIFASVYLMAIQVNKIDIYSGSKGTH